MAPSPKKFKVDVLYEPTTVYRCNAAIGGALLNSSNNKENQEPPAEDLKQIIKEQSHLLQTIKETLSQQSETMAKHTIMLERIAARIFPKSSTLKIFPFKNMDQLKNVDAETENIPDNQLIAYIKENIGKSSISKCFDLMFDSNIILQINWNDPKKNLFSIRSLKFFHTYLFEAVKSTEYGFLQYEEDMKKGLRLAKNRFYKYKYNLQHKTT